MRVGNPLDYHTFIWDDRVRLEQLFDEVLAGPQDATMLVLDVPEAEGDFSAFRKTAHAMVAARQRSGGPVLVVSGVPENLGAGLARDLSAGGVTPVRGIEEALAGLGAAVRWGEARYGAPSPFPAAVPPPTGAPVPLNEVQAKARLKSWGVPVPDGRVASLETVGVVAETIGYPVAVKALGLDHKTERGGVRTGLRSAADLHEAVRAMSETHRGRFLVEEMVEDVVAELLVSVRRQWPVGWLVTIGAGGVATELLDDLAHLLAPVTRQEVRDGHRHPASRADPGRISRRPGRRPQRKLAAAVTDLVSGALRDGDVVEMEVNPLLVTSSQAVAVDALLTVIG